LAENPLVKEISIKLAQQLMNRRDKENFNYQGAAFGR
jgi:hypothetical protein